MCYIISPWHQGPHRLPFEGVSPDGRHRHRPMPFPQNPIGLPQGSCHPRLLGGIHLTASMAYERSFKLRRQGERRQKRACVVLKSKAGDVNSPRTKEWKDEEERKH
jgi:hypothetical protein